MVLHRPIESATFIRRETRCDQFAKAAPSRDLHRLIPRASNSHDRFRVVMQFGNG